MAVPSVSHLMSACCSRPSFGTVGLLCSQRAVALCQDPGVAANRLDWRLRRGGKNKLAPMSFSPPRLTPCLLLWSCALTDEGQRTWSEASIQHYYTAAGACVQLICNLPHTGLPSPFSICCVFKHRGDLLTMGVVLRTQCKPCPEADHSVVYLINLMQLYFVSHPSAEPWPWILSLFIYWQTEMFFAYLSIFFVETLKVSLNGALLKRDCFKMYILNQDVTQI